MENKRAVFVALICFAISLALMTMYVHQKRKEMTADFGEEVPVVIAIDTIPEYGLIRPEMVATATVFKNFRQPQTVEDVDEVIGKATFVPIYKGEQITLTKLVHQDGKPVLDRQVEKKMRAVTISISPHTGVGRLVRPGNRVDVLAAPNYDYSGQTIFEVKTLVQNVLVLAAGKNIQNAVPTRVSRQVLDALEAEFEARKRKDFGGTTTDTLNTHRPDDNYTTLTLQLTPEEAEKVMFVSHTFGDNRLYFTLRNNSDQEVAKLDTTLLDHVLGPDSDYGRSKRKPPNFTPPKPRFYDNRGGQQVPVY